MILCMERYINDLKLYTMEQELFDAVEVGDVASVINLVTTNKDLNVDCTDNLGRTPLNIATSN